MMARAAGKVIVFGEHAVVYGRPAIAVGIDRGVRAVARPTDGPSRVRVVSWHADDPNAEQALSTAFQRIVDVTRESLAAEGRTLPDHVDVEVDAELAHGAGLGCSAAMGVAIARALDGEARSAQIAERVMAWERVFHGNPSGIDAAVSAMGGCVYFTKGAPIERVLLRTPLTLVVGHSGVTSGTREMVDSVARIRERKPESTEKSFDAIETLVRNARLALEAGDLGAVGKLLDLNQMLLGGLMLSTPEIERMCSIARGEGALGAKLTGAGGGGCVLALVASHDVATRVQEEWLAAGYQAFVTRVGAPLSMTPSSDEEGEGSVLG